MTALQLLRHLRQRGVSIWIEGDRLRYRAPKGTLTPELRSELLARKSQLMDLLRPPERISREGLLPLSPIQEGFWYLEQLNPGNRAFNIARAWRLEGPVSLKALAQSFQTIVQRHEILRAACITQDGQPGLRISPEVEVVLGVTDLRDREHATRESHAIELATQLARRPYDLARPPLLRPHMFRLGADSHLLLLAAHHFVTDGWSLGVLLHELSAIYEARVSGSPVPLPELPIQYVDLVHWQRQQLNAGVLEEQLDYWVRKLRGAPALLEVQTDYPRPPAWSYHGSTHTFALEPELSDALRSLSRHEGCTLFQTLLAAFQVLLHSYTGQDDMIVGTTVSNRNRQEAEQVIGSFASNLVLRTDLSGDPAFRVLLDRVRDVTWEAYAHQDLPFNRLVNALQPERNTGHYLLYQVAILLHHRRGDQTLRLPGVVVQRAPIDLGTAQLDLFLEMVDAGQRLTGTIEYSTDLFSEATIERMARRYQSLLARIVADPQACISQLAREPEGADASLVVRRAKLSAAKRALLQKRLEGVSVPRAEAQPIPRLGPTDVPALSHAQESYLYLEQLQPGNPAYNRPMALRLRGPLNVDTLQRSLSEVVRRHEILRTAYPSQGGRPVVLVRPAEPVALPVVRVEGSAAGVEARVQELISEQVRQPFTLAEGPLMRATLLQVAEQDHLLLLVKHHIIFDGYSETVLVNELGALYSAFLRGKPSPLPELPIQYSDFAHWKRQRVSDGTYDSQLAYWQNRLAGAPRTLDLPAGRPKTGVRSREGGCSRLTLPLRLGKALKDLSREQDVTLFVTMLSAFQALIYRYTGQMDLVIGSPIAGRAHLETQQLIGNFTEVLALRSDLSGNPRFRDLLGRVRQVSLESQAHQDVPFEEVMRRQSPNRAIDRTRLYQIMFNFEPVPTDRVEAQDLTVERFDLEPVKPLYNLSLEVMSKPKEIVCRLECGIDLYGNETAARMLDHYQILLEAASADPECRLSELPLLTEAERHLQLVEWNEPHPKRGPASCVHEMFEAQVRRTPEAPALVMGGWELTYRELNERANRLAHHLRDVGVGPEMLVGLCLERSPDMMIGLLATLKAGGASVPLAPTLPEERIGFLLRDTEMTVLLTQKHIASGLPPSRPRVICLDTDAEQISQYDAGNPICSAGSGNLAYVLYTSGSTGEPKGAMIDHGALASFAAAASKEYAMSPGDRVLQFASISFDAALEEIFIALVSGATLVLRTDDTLVSVASFLEMCRDQAVTVLDLPTAFWHELVPELGSESVVWPATVRLVLIGGEKAHWDRMVVWQEHLGPEVRLVNTYGPSEATVVATMCDLPASIETPGGTKEIPIGRPMPNAQVYVLDRHHQPVPIGVVGELCIGGRGLARGYLNRPALTAQNFIPHPFSEEPGARLYRTGDRVRYYPDGSIEFLGRLDQQVKIRGFRVELGEIEAALRQHEAVREAVVLAKEAPAPLRTDKELEAYVQLEPELEADATELRTYLRKRLPEYMVPAAFLFLGFLPLTSSNKVDRQALRSLDIASPQPTADAVPPATPTESLMAETWQAVLGVDRISVYDNFFDLGGHSLLSMQVIARMEERTGVRINPREMIVQTLGQLARLYDERAERIDAAGKMNLGQRLRRTIRRRT